MLLDYNVFMAKYVNPQAPERSPTATESPGHSPESSPKTTKKVGDRGIHERLNEIDNQPGKVGICPEAPGGLLELLVMSLDHR